MAAIVLSSLASSRGADSKALPPNVRLYVNYAAKPDPQAVLAHEWCILDPAAEVPLMEGRALGHTHLAYVSTVEVVPGTNPAIAAEKRGIPLMGRNPGWNSAVLNITHAAWRDWLLEDVVRPAIHKGYDGVFLDTLDSVMRITSQDPALAPGCHAALVQAVQEIRRQFPDKRIVLNRGFRYIEQVAGDIDGVLIESLYQTFSSDSKAYAATQIQGTEWLLSHIQRIQEKKLPVFVVDYVPRDDAELARATAERIRAKGCIPFITTPDLQGEELAPLREVPRRIAVLHGRRPESSLQPHAAADTLTAELLQTPLEWLGCQVEFIDIGQSMPPSLSPLRYRGVLLDENLDLPVERQNILADWVLAQQRNGLKLLFTGTIPFHRETVARRVFQALAISGSVSPLKFEKPPSITGLDGKPLIAETAAQVPTASFPAIIAPRNSKVWLSMQGREVKGTVARTDPVFLAEWGGALLLRGVPDHASRQIDLHEFLASWMGMKQSFPVPDVTTRDGMRAFHSHIDADGFVSRSAIEGKICAEAVRDQVLRMFPLPVTVSVIEAEIEAHLFGLDPAAASRYRDVARSIYALPNVQAASHTYSHPFRWMDRDTPTAGQPQAPRNLMLKPWVNYGEDISIEREVRGSSEYINRVLLPFDKRVEMILWSGDCRPGAEALRLCRELGLENMSGSPSRLVRHYPGLASVPPNHSAWNGEIQVLGAHQQGSPCATGHPGPFYGSVDNVTEAFMRTESPRRLKPVNACGHFYSATYLTSLRAMEKVFGWCMEQPLHAITSRQYAQIVRDACTTRIYENGPGRWIISNAGHARTFRFPAGAEEPDIASSKGITGWVRHGDALYIHTNGLPVTELVLGAETAPHLRLTRSSGEIEFRSLAPAKAQFRVADLRPVQVAFAGAAPRAVCELLVNGQSMRLEADEHGCISLNLPATADATLDFSTARYAAQR